MISRFPEPLKGPYSDSSEADSRSVPPANGAGRGRRSSFFLGPGKARPSRGLLAHGREVHWRAGVVSRGGAFVGQVCGPTPGTRDSSRGAWAYRSERAVRGGVAPRRIRGCPCPLPSASQPYGGGTGRTGGFPTARRSSEAGETYLRQARASEGGMRILLRDAGAAIDAGDSILVFSAGFDPGH